MSNYSQNARSCRVEFFKPNGKWFTTAEIEFETYLASEASIYAAFHNALKALLYKDGAWRNDGMWAVCLDPYHEHEHPLMVVVGGEHR